MENLVSGLILAIKVGLISKALARVYIVRFISSQYGIAISDKTIKKLSKKSKPEGMVYGEDDIKIFRDDC